VQRAAQEGGRPADSAQPPAPGGAAPALQRAPQGDSALGRPAAQPPAAPVRQRGGLGAPLDALPPTAGLPRGTAPLLGGRGPVQRIPDPAASSTSAPTPGYGTPGVPAPPLSTASPGMVLRREGTARDAAASDGAAVQRAIDAGQSAAQRGPTRRAWGTQRGGSPAPTVAAEPAPQSGAGARGRSATSSSDRTQSGGQGVPVQRQALRPPGSGAASNNHDAAVQRRPLHTSPSTGASPTGGHLAPAQRHTEHAPRHGAAPSGPGTAEQRPLVRPSTVGDVPRATEPIQRTRALLGGRRLGFALAAAAASSSAPPSAPAPAAKPTPPVVQAAWRRDSPARPESPTVTTSATPRSWRSRTAAALRLPRRLDTNATPPPAGTAVHPASLRPAPATPLTTAGAQPTVQRSLPTRTPIPGSAAPPTPTVPRGATPPTRVVRLAPPSSAPTPTTLQRLPVDARPTRPGPAHPAFPAPAPATSPATAQVLQRVAAQAGLAGVPLTAVPPRTPTVPAPPALRAHPTTAAPPITIARSTSAAVPPRPPGEPAAPTAGPDVDELARRLVEPVGRLLRTELRRGRERAGRPYDNRR
jgi:hypothetical protein